jgi:hypothetical protein
MVISNQEPSHILIPTYQHPFSLDLKWETLKVHSQ